MSSETLIPFAALAAVLAVPEEALRPFARRIAAGIASANEAPGLPADLAPAFAVEDAAVLILAWHARAAGTPVALAGPLAAAATAFLGAVAGAIAAPPAPP